MNKYHVGVEATYSYFGKYEEHGYTKKFNFIIELDDYDLAEDSIERIIDDEILNNIESKVYSAHEDVSDLSVEDIDVLFFTKI